MSFATKYNNHNMLYDEIAGPSLEEVEDIFRSLALIGRSPPGEARVVAGGEAGPGRHPRVTRLGGGGGLGAGACLSSHIAEVLLNGGHRCWVLSKVDGAGQGLDWSIVTNLYQGDKLCVLPSRSPHILLLAGPWHIGSQSLGGGWHCSKGGGAGQGLGCSVVSPHLDQGGKLREYWSGLRSECWLGLLDSSQILLLVGSRHIGRQ